MYFRIRNFTISILVFAIIFAFAGSAMAEAKNVILMISDGLGMNGWEAAKIYEGGTLPYENYSLFKFYGSTTYMLDSSGSPQGYDPSRMWSEFNYSREAFTDSAAAATAINSGVKTRDGAINVDFAGDNLFTLQQWAEKTGRSTGTVTSVQISHATSAAVAAHNPDRGDYVGIANEMIYSSGLDVIMGAGEGHPTNKYVGGDASWADITDGDGANGMTYVGDVSDFKALAGGTYNGGAMPEKVIGVAHTEETIGDEYQPGENDETLVPTLETMTRAALNVLSGNGKGFYLQIEGGAVDWENHGKSAGTMLIEQKDFDDSVASVIEWIENNGGWEENLLIVTADHETGMIWGEGTWTDVNTDNRYDEGVDLFNGFHRVQDSDGDGVPEILYGSADHTNQLVPLWAAGAGSELLESLVDGVDGQAAAFWLNAFDPNWDGSYIDNTDIFKVMRQAMGAPVPAPAAVWLLGPGLAGLFGLRAKTKK